MLHANVIPSHLTRNHGVGKPRRAVGDPVAPLKQMTRFIPIPEQAPGLLKVPFSIFDPKASTAAVNAGKLVFHCVGDVGGIHGTATEEAIAVAMENQITAAAADARPAFLYLLGDVIYFNGQSAMYKTEFYEPYQFYPNLIFAIPGNHDGDTQVNKGDAPDTEPSLYGFFQNFCAAQPTYVSPYRMSMTQPYAYWTLDAPFVTMIGLYSNVEGSLDARGRMDQQALFAAADGGGRSGEEAADYGAPSAVFAGQRAWRDGGYSDGDRPGDSGSGRIPDAVLSGHVHNYQRFTRTLKGKTIPYVVAGAGGYANDARSMHKIQSQLLTAPLPYQTTMSDVMFEKFEENEPGFLRITASAKEILFEYFRVPFVGAAELTPFDSFTA